MVVKFKKLDKDAVAPIRANPMDAGWDLTARMHDWDTNYKIMTYFTGIAVAIPEGYVGLLFPRSSIYKRGIALANSVGVIDAGFRGEILLKFRATTEDNTTFYSIGDRIGQLVIMPIGDIFFDETQELPESDRGDRGFGSSDLLNRLSS